jgi:8-oxo-dGTP diphosphatase
MPLKVTVKTKIRFNGQEYTRVEDMPPQVRQAYERAMATLPKGGAEASTRPGTKLIFNSLKRGVDYIGVGVGAIIVDGQGRLFLARRGPQAKNERGLWEFPGGSVEFGEKLADALQREIREEYGVEIAVGELLDVVDHILPAEGQHWVSPTFICKVTSGEPHIREPGKCAEIAWFHLHEIPEDLTQVTRWNLAHYRERMS